MEPDGEGCFSFTLTLGENRFESFQIWLDGDSTRVLHPGEVKAPKGGTVFGPCDEAEAYTSRWTIDGRPEEWAQWCEEGAAEVGYPGDQFRVQLHMAGKWRSVTWEKVSSTPQLADASSGALEVSKNSRYYVTGDFNQWSLTEMERIPDVPGFFHLDVALTRVGGEFQIVKDKDLYQVLYPPRPRTDWQGPDEEVLGPDDESYNKTWYLDGHPGDVVRIEFQRVHEMEVDLKKVSWRYLKSSRR